jgi:formylglycine-generating enzyme required for sulfatase activity
MVLVGATDGAGVAAAALVVLGALLALSRSRRGALAALALGVGCAETPQVRAPQAPLGAYCMDRTEVTIEAFAKCVEAGACSRPDGYDDSLRSTKHQCNWERDEHGSHPVNCIDWEQAATFCAWKGWRLPSADEWQWAARGGARASNFPWGNAAVEGRACFHRRDGSCPVATFPRGASADGIQDLAGNVSEWVSDGEEGAPSRQAYGGSWFDDDGTELRSDAVRTKPGRYRSFSIGFRCAVGAR